MTPRGRPKLRHPRDRAAYVRFSATEWGALKRALAAEYPVPSRRPNLSEWIRDLVVGHATEVLQVEVTRAGVRHLEGGVPDWKRWRIRRAVQRAAKQRRGKKRSRSKKKTLTRSKEK